MPLIDERGRLFGRFNIVDAALVVFLLVLLPIVYTASRLFRVPTPVMERVEPATQPVGSNLRIRVYGRHMRPYLRALISGSGQPFALPDDQTPVDKMGSILLETSSTFELRLPNLSPGSYDIHLLDTTKEVARLTNAFTLTAVKASGIVRARIRFIALPEVAQLVREQDLDVSPSGTDPAKGTLQAARLEAVRVVARSVPSNVEFDAGWGATIIEAEVAIPVNGSGKGAWTYGSQMVRPGDAFTFQTTRYTMSGRIGEATLVTPDSAGATPPVTQ